MSIATRLRANRVVPLIQADEADVAVETARALAAGGLDVVEVVLRTESALTCLQAIADRVPEVLPGAGTVLNADQASAVLDRGAQFIVSPGLDEGVVDVAQKGGVPVFPGTMTPTEVQRAVNLGLQTVKLFPAAIAGGVLAVKTLASVFRSVEFMPTGGITASNLGDFLALPSVLACGGSWLTPRDAIAAGEFNAVTALAAQAAEIGRMAKEGGE